MEDFLKEISNIMVRDVITINHDEPVSKALSIMRDYDISVLPVIQDNKLIGLIDRLRILESGFSPNTKTGSIAESSPSLSPRDTILDTARTLVAHKFEALPVLDDKKKLVGIVARYDIVKYAYNIKWLDKFRVKDVMSTNLITISPHDSIGKARKMLVSHAIRQLPVVDGNKLIGIVSIRDILERVYSVKLKRARMGEVVGETESIFSRPVKSIMSRPVFYVNVEDRLSKVGEIMIEKEVFSTPVVDRKGPVGIVTRGDIVRLIASRVLEVMLPISFKGLEYLQPHLVGLVNVRASKTFNRLIKMVDVFEGSIVLKKQRVEGTRNIYFAEVSAKTARGVFSVSEESWDAVQAIVNALKLLEKQVEKSITRKREAKRRKR
ncbi:MAG: hypothetical protein DRJ38_06085 [Thermoprotei archaeon]|nr:MAG: hypothetical protein DRJ38_06085 [Thermoprotei archaeon]